MNRAEYLGLQRWFAGAETDVEITRVEALPWIIEPSGGFGVRFELVHVEGADGPKIYNVPASYRREPFRGLDDALMDVEDGVFVYDAMHDAHARTALLSGFFDGDVGGVGYHRDGDLGIPADVPTIPLVAEQSNTSIIVGEGLLWKLFRIIGPGSNPDIEVGRALTATGSSEIAPVRGWMTLRPKDGQGEIDLAMLYDYFPTATDGWDSARASFRDLLAEPEPALEPAEAGADFAAEAHRLGRTVASVHGLMAELGTGSWSGVELTDLAIRLGERFAEAAGTAPELVYWLEAARAEFGEIGRLDSVAVQRVHGDLHLGQTLRTVDGWKIFDFEGEPAKPLSDRRRPDSALRDVAAMLRSFDYAPRSVLMQIADESETSSRRASAWTDRNSEAFLRGYGIGEDPAAYLLLRCYQIDKAAYEVAYEKEHRPQWITIPLDALARLLG